MKFYATILLFLTSLVSAQAQNNVSILNQYKYVYLTSGNVAPFARFSLYDDAVARLTECGMKVIKKKERQQITDTCTIVFCDILQLPVPAGSGHIDDNTCIQLHFTDCNRKPVFVSKMGYSGVLLKGTKWGYEIAASEALQSLDNYHYVYFAP